MKESRLILALLLAGGMTFASVVVWAGEAKHSEAHPDIRSETEGSHSHKEAKKGEKEATQKNGTATGAVAPQPSGHSADEEDEEEGSH